MKIEFIGKFYDNHSLSIVNRNLVTSLYKLKDILGITIKVISLDSYNAHFKIDRESIKIIKSLEAEDSSIPDIQIRHSYPPIWNWPEYPNTKIVYIQPWEYPKVPFEWQYKFETFADGLIVPSHYCESVFIRGGIDPTKTFVVPNGYNESIFNHESVPVRSDFYDISPNNFNFVYVGNTQWRKGLDILLNSWTKVFRKADKAKLIIKDNPSVYGTSNILEEIVKMQYKSGCAEITYIGDNLSETDMAYLYKMSKVIVHPYRAEGFGMHIQEAVACGCIPIISANGPTDDFIPENVGFRIDTTPVAIDITDSRVFALKPGDSTTGMGTHTFIQEPISNSLEHRMHNLYHTHDKKDILQAVKNINTLTTWNKMAEDTVIALRTIMGTSSVKRT